MNQPLRNELESLKLTSNTFSNSGTDAVIVFEEFGNVSTIVVYTIQPLLFNIQSILISFILVS